MYRCNMTKILIIMLILLVTGSTFYMNSAYADIWTDLFDVFTNNHEKLYLDLLKDYDILASEYDDLASEYDSLNSEYIQVFSDYSDLTFDYDDLASEYDSLNSEYIQVFSDYSDLTFDYDDLASEYDSLNSEYIRVFSDYSDLTFDYDDLSSEYDSLYDEYDTVYDDRDDLYDDYDELYADYDSLWNETHLRTTISGTSVYWDFSDSKGNLYSWSMPIATFENQIEYNTYHTYQQTHVNPYLLDLNGRTIKMLNLDGFLQKSFTDTIDLVYDNSYDSSDFIREVWYIVSQMTVYDYDITERSEGRYALETFTRTGGDCEDLVILIADMLMSSKHTKSWTFEYVLMDSDNPTNPQNVNHAILYVHDGQYRYYIEATAPPSWDYYPQGVVGWYYPVI